MKKVLYFFLYSVLVGAVVLFFKMVQSGLVVLGTNSGQNAYGVDQFTFLFICSLLFVIMCIGGFVIATEAQSLIKESYDEQIIG